MSLNCPRCNTPLSVENINKVTPNLTVGEVEVDECKSCNGIWFDKGELEEIEDVIEPVLFEIRKIPKTKEQLAPLSCPKCDSVELNKVQSTRDKKVIMDVCPECDGVWLDGGELNAIQKENAAAVIWDLIRWMS